MIMGKADRSQYSDCAHRSGATLGFHEEARSDLRSEKSQPLSPQWAAGLMAQQPGGPGATGAHAGPNKCGDGRMGPRQTDMGF